MAIQSDKFGRKASDESTPLLAGNGKARLKHSNKNVRRTSFMNRSAAAEPSSKLGTVGGVFVPTVLNVLSILMFLRFGFILGQAGLLSFLAMLIVCYLINLVTTMSISAIASNGTVRGGGAYYLISRSLGPEFGGSIGIILYLGFAFNTGLNAVGLIDCFAQDYGATKGNWDDWLNDTYWWRYLWASIVLILCTAVCLAGSSLFARCSNALLVVLLISALSIPVSTFFVHPFEAPELHLIYSGLSMKTLRENLFPHFTRGAAGSELKGRENLQDLFGILFPATGGIFAGASMSGDLKNPSRSIPKGTLYGLAVTFVMYALVIIAMAASIPRVTLYRNANVIQDVNMSGALILMGEIATSLFSVLMGVIGSAKLLQALARDKLIPGVSIFGHGTKKADEPILAIIFTYVISQLTMLSDINTIASFITMAYLMTFLVTNLACFLLKVSAAPNFRPSFRYFNSMTAALGTVASGATMFFVDGLSASACLIVIIVLFGTIHYTAVPKSWGDVSQSLIYHQVRKYLLRLRQEHVKFWRPQILLFVNDPRRSYKLIQFCNSLKKGGLFVLGHVIVTQDFAAAVPEAKKQQENWMTYIDFSRVKAFVNVVISPGVEWGTRNVVLSSGLGSMKPNIIIMGFYNLEEYRATQPATTPPRTGSRPTTPLPQSAMRRRRTIDSKLQGDLPTDNNRPEKAVGASTYLTILEDLILQMKVNVAIAKGFGDLELPHHPTDNLDRVRNFLRSDVHNLEKEDPKNFIDLWPIQMSAEIAADDDQGNPGLTTTNFDTYALILQLGCILHTVKSWKSTHHLRVQVFVEYESDVYEEKGRLEMLLSNLRIRAEVCVSWLASGNLKTYEAIVNGVYPEGDEEIMDYIDDTLKDDEWWQDIKQQRGNGSPDAISSKGRPTSKLDPLPDSVSLFSHASSRVQSVSGVERLLRRVHGRPSVASLGRLGVSLTMQTHRLDPDLVENHATTRAASSDTDTSSDESSGEETEQSVQFDSPKGSERSSRRDSAPRFPTNVPQTEKEDERDDLSDPPPVARRHRRSSSTPAIRWEDDLEVPQSALSRAVTNPPSPDILAAVPPEALFNDGDGNNLSTEQSKPPAPSRRPTYNRQKSMPKMSSSLMPRTQVATEEGPGPSIMFSTPSPPIREARLYSIYARQSSRKLAEAEDQDAKQSSQREPFQKPNEDGAAQSPSTSVPFSSQNSTQSFPFSASQQISFNGLPSRAQYLILNELMRQKSSAGQGKVQNRKRSTSDEQSHFPSTAVILTTLPAPTAGTCSSEQDSLHYLEDLEAFCHQLPPVLLVHSNSMTVTTAL